MTKEEILDRGSFILNKSNPNYSEFKLNLYLGFFDKEQEVRFYNLPSLDSEPQMTVITEIINELLNYESDNKEWLKNEIWNHYIVSIENTSYGMVPDEGFENEVDANRAYFRIYNQEDSYNSVTLNEIWIDIDFTQFRHFNLSFKCPWDDEHGLSIGVKNGKFDSIT